MKLRIFRNSRRNRIYLGLVGTLTLTLLLLLIFTPLYTILKMNYEVFRALGFSEKGRSMIFFFSREYLRYFTATLPEDEEIIAHFNNYRAEFERLVRLYRGVERIDMNGLHNEDEYWIKLEKSDLWKTLLKQTGIGRVHGSMHCSLWLSDPYSIETARQAEKENFLKARKYQEIYIDFAEREKYNIPSLRYDYLQKSLIYFPIDPQEIDGQLLYPVDLHGFYCDKRRVFSSLNRYPENLKPLETVFRKIEPQWYIQMHRE